MSTTLSAQLTALETTLTNDLAALTAEVKAAVAAFANVNAGDVITQAQLDALTTLDTGITAATASLTAAITPAPAPAPAP